MSSTRASGSIGEAEALGELAGRALGGVASRAATPSRVGSLPSTMFSATVITGMSMKCWCTMPIPASIASFGELERDAARPLTRISPSSGLVEPVEDVHQRRLAGAVLAEQRVHLAAAQVEVDVVVRDDSGEVLRDPAQLEDRTLVSHARA